jgi:alpha-L-arabinofuranosidase
MTQFSGTLVRAWLVLGCASLVRGADDRSLSPPVLLPNGREFKTWETSLQFSRTYYVTPSHPQASDENSGAQDKPLRTINRAAQVLQPGERVVIGAGTYRERVRPARSGTGPDRMISYEAAPGATVVLSGSMPLTGRWTPSVHDGRPGPAVVRMFRLPAGLFPDENPFRLVNLADEQIDKCMDWAVGTKGKAPNTLRRGLVFQDGQRLRQVAAYAELAAAPGSYWVEPDGRTVHLHPLQGADPNQAQIEVTVRGMVFAPSDCGLGYIRVKGLTVQHSGNCFPRPQEGAISARRGHHWIIEDTIVRQCNAIGIDIGNQFDTSGPPLAEGGRHIVRRNVVSDCGIGGIEGTGIQHTLIEENRISGCGWQRAQYIWETGGIKVHCTVGTLLRKNLIQDSIDAPGIWMDYENQNSRCTQNVVIRAGADQGGIFMEASQRPNMVDRNVVWASTRSGIYQHDCDELIIAHNLIGQCGDAAVRMQVCQGRQVGGRTTTAKRNKIVNNVFIDNGRELAISDPDNVCDYNVFSPGRRPFDLGQWQRAHGWDKHSFKAEIEANWNPRTLELTWSGDGETAPAPAVDGVTYDFWDHPFPGKLAAPGPFGPVPRRSAKIRLGHAPDLR